MPERIRFNKRTVEALKRPERDRRWIYDSGCAQLALCVWSSGRKVWYWYGRADGKVERIRLGEFPSMTVEQARKACRRVQGAIAAGKNPADERREVRKLRTLKDLHTLYMEVRGPHLKSTRDVDFRWRKHLSRYASRPLLSIRRGTVQDWHREIAEAHGKVSANRAIGLVRTLFNCAIRSERWTRPNPASGFQRFDEGTGRERFMSAEELARWFAAVEAEPSATFRDFFKLLLFTAARRANACAMRWEDVSFDRRTWTIPAHDAKARRPITIPLIAQALEILERRRKSAGDSPWVFPSWGKSGHLTEPAAAWKRVCSRAGLDNLTMHDVRRSAGSAMALNGVSLQVIARALGHTSTAATRIYARMTDTAVRDAVEDTISRLLTDSRCDEEG